MRELQLAARGLVRSPAFTLPALVVLALGIGGTTGVFSVVNSVLLRPLAFPDAPRLARIWSRNDERRIEFLSVAPADLQDWRLRAPRAGRLAAYERPMPLLLRDGGTAHVLALRAEGELFDLLGTPAALGRTLAPGDARSTNAVISHGLWTSRFGGSADALGQPLVTDDQVWTIVGVMPRGFGVPNAAADLWLPLALDQTVPGRFAHTLRVLVRMQDGGPEDVRRDLAVVAAQLAGERPAQNRGWSVTVRPLFDTVVSPEFARSLWLILGAVLFTLLMASTTVAGLLLARASARDREFAVRLALGATRGELVRMLLGECLVLAAAAGALGLLLALWGVDAMKAFGPTSVPRIDEVAIDGRVALFAALATVATALVAVMAPAWQATRRMQDRLRVRDGLTDAPTSRLRDVLVGLQVATAVLLLVGAALLAQTAINLRGRELGFDVDRLVTAQVVLPAAQPGDPDGATRMETHRARVARLPGVSHVAVASGLPFSGQNSGNTFVMDDGAPADQPPDTDYRVVGAGYFDAMGIPLRAGRGIGDADGPGNPSIVVSETAARRYWPGRDPLGRRVRIGNSGWMTIVGVAGDARYGALDDPGNDVRPMMYLPHRQMPDTPVALVVRAEVAPESLAGVVRDALLEGGGGIGVEAVQTMTSTIRTTTGPQRFTATLATVFAGVVTVLASLALYGLLAFVVGRRTREIGLRLALGASRRDVAGIVASRAGVPVVGGLVMGLLASAAVSGALQSVLFGVGGTDVTTYGAVAGGVALLAVAASCLPARRAMHVDPMSALRAE